MLSSTLENMILSFNYHVYISFNLLFFSIPLVQDMFNLHGFFLSYNPFENLAFYHFTGSHPSLPSIFFLMTSNDREKVFILSYSQKAKGGGKAIRINFSEWYISFFLLNSYFRKISLKRCRKSNS